LYALIVLNLPENYYIVVALFLQSLNRFFMLNPFARLVCLSIILTAFVSCSSKKQEVAKDTLFQLLPSSQTGVSFTNTISDNNEMNIFNYHNFYNGGGVAIGDVNNDGKPDIFFTSNQGSNKLYINKGNFKFEDVTANANLMSKHKWHTGVSMVDINADGWLDIYVCNAGIINGDDRANELYINQKDGTFKEQAHEYGLDDKGASTQAVFFDYDHDGDLDCFVLNNSPRSIDNFGYKKNLRGIRDSINGDRLYRNDNGKFTDVSSQAGIYGSEIAFGLGIAVGDVNNDGWDDIYACNDFFEHDYLYINQRNGTFKEVSTDAIGHMSNGSMGCDIADINNDGYLDIFTAEMLPESDYRLKTTVKFDDYDVANAKNQLDLHHQFTSNSLQLNNRDGTFSEVAQLAGVDATGWSWSSLFFDFDNDGYKDLYLTNGLKRDLTDEDFLSYFNNPAVMSKVASREFGLKDILDKIPSVPIPNYGFLNKGDLSFQKQTESLGFNTPTFSNGAAYADLDGDGDLDLVVNNIDTTAFIYKNTTSEKLHKHYLKVGLKGTDNNTLGYGAKVALFSNNKQRLQEQQPCRGFESSVEPVLLFGLDTATKVDSLIVQWPNQKQQTIKDVKSNQTIVLNQNDAVKNITPLTRPSTIYTEVAETTIVGNFRHRENEFVDFDGERLLPKMLSTEGPKLAIADVNGDGLEDFYLGSATGDTAKIFIQQKDGKFIQKPQQAFITDKIYESIGAEFFDADGDGDMDLIVASGGNIALVGSPYLQPRLYINDGKGNFTRSTNALPAVSLNASCVRVGDFNGDDKQDIFIGARNIPGTYGVPPSSVLLQNNGNGTFTNVTASIAPQLSKAGMITDAQWVDIDKDGKKELVIVGDWMPVTVFKYINGKFSKIYEVPNSSGWWNCLTVADVNEDGAPDLIAGNFGLNSNIKADKEHPAKLYVKDFDNNGQTECLPVYYKTDGKAYPYNLKGEIEAVVPSIKKAFLHYASFAGKTIDEIFSPAQLKNATVLTVNETRTSAFINDGQGHFTIQPLPVMAQLSPTFGILSKDINGDGINDLFIAGNFYGLKPQTGRLDANYGTVLLGDKKGFKYMPPVESGLFIKGEARDVASIKTKSGKDYIVVAMNNDKLRLFKRIKKV
jgi:enediyne biosynthesis protein E4